MQGLISYVVLAVIAGFCLPTQAGINAALGRLTGSVVTAAAISFAAGTLALVVYLMVLKPPLPAPAAVLKGPWWIWSGGLVGAFFVVASIVLAPELGAASMVALIIAGQLTASIVLDHFGLLGYAVDPFTLRRAAGVVLLVLGAVLIKGT